MKIINRITSFSLLITLLFSNTVTANPNALSNSFATLGLGLYTAATASRSMVRLNQYDARSLILAAGEKALTRAAINLTSNLATRGYTSLANYIRSSNIDTSSYAFPEQSLRFVDPKETSYLNYLKHREQMLGKTFDQLPKGAKINNQLLLPKSLASRTLDIHSDGRSYEFIVDVNTVKNPLTVSSDPLHLTLTGDQMAGEIAQLQVFQQHIEQFGDQAMLRFLTCMSAEAPFQGDVWPLQQVANELGCNTMGYNRLFHIVEDELNPIFSYTKSAPATSSVEELNDLLATPGFDAMQYVQQFSKEVGAKVKVRIFFPGE